VSGDPAPLHWDWTIPETSYFNRRFREAPLPHPPSCGITHRAH
jgi:hypothetical protein